MGKKSKKSNTPKPSKQEIALADVASKKFDIYKKYYRPLAKRQLEDTKATPGKIKQAQGIVNADLQQSAAGRDANLAGLGAAGGKQMGSSNRSILMRGSSERAMAGARGQGMGLARQGVEGIEREGKLRHVALGHGIARGTMASMADQARNATAESIQRSQIDLQESNALATSIGQGLGAYAGYKDVFGDPSGASSGRPQFGMYQLGTGGTDGGFAGRSMR